MGYEVVCFLDLYKGYYQVLMDEGDAIMTAFATNFGVFAFKYMPFGLKNAGATYQRMVDFLFRAHIGKIVEVYVDDIVIKSKEKASAVDNL